MLADDLHALRELEKQMDIEPDWNVNAYMRAETVENRRRSVLTAFVIRMLGLSICSDTEVWDSTRKPGKLRWSCACARVILCGIVGVI